MNEKETFEKYRDRLLGTLMPIVLTYFVVSDYFNNDRIDNDVVFWAWIGVCVGAGTGMVERYFGNGGNNGRK